MTDREDAALLAVVKLNVWAREYHGRALLYGETKAVEWREKALKDAWGHLAQNDKRPAD